MPLISVAIGIALLFVLISLLRFNAFLSFVVVAVTIGLLLGLSLEQSLTAFQKGMGDSIGGLLLILALGAMLGKVMGDSGAAVSVTHGMVALFGKRNIRIALMAAGFLVGIPMFYTVGFVILVPLVFSIAVTLRMPLLHVGMPMLASLSVTHGFLPPHPAPTALVHMFNADMGLTLAYGLVVAVPCVLIGGLWASRLGKNIISSPRKELTGDISSHLDDDRPSVLISVTCALLPVLLIVLAPVSELLLPSGSFLVRAFAKAGNPPVAMLISVILAVIVLQTGRGTPWKKAMEGLTEGVTGITLVLLTIAAAGGLKELFVTAGVDDYLAGIMTISGVNPLLLGFFVAALIRVSLGSATVAGLTAAGIMAPMVGNGVSAELMVLAIGSGSIMFSHVNDSGFWLFKEYFNLSIGQTLRTWTLMETAVAIIGIVCVLLLDNII